VYLTGSVLNGEVGLFGYALGPEVVMGLLLAINPAGQSLFMLLFGRVADDAGRKPLIVAGMAGSGAFALVQSGALLPAGLYPRIAVAALGMVVIAAAFSAMTTGALAFIGDVAPASRESELMGLRSTAKGVGGVVGPGLFGAIATVAGIQFAFAVGSVLAFVAAGLAGATLVESKPARAAAPAPGDD
jgi:MFS family permease